MNLKLQAKLYKKYPDIFANVKIKNSSMSQGICVGDGWYNLVDSVCYLIQQHVKEKDLVEIRNPIETFKRCWNRYIWDKAIYPLVNKLPFEDYLRCSNQFRFNVPRYVWSTIPREQITLEQVKEKFGTLTIYTSGGNDYTDGVIDMARNLSSLICEECGTMDGVKITKTSWIRTLCKECTKKHKSRK